MKFITLLITFLGFHTTRISAQSSTQFDICCAYKTACQALLNGIDCAAQYQKITGCPSAGGTIVTFVGECTCKKPQFTTGSVRVQENLIDNRVKKFVPSLLVYTTSINTTIDILASYTAVCKETLTLLGCPNNSQTIHAGSSQHFRGICNCGQFQAASTRVAELIVDTLDAAALPPSPTQP